MSVMDGIQMLRGIKNNIPASQIPVVMLTARADISSRISGIGKEADSYLLIPFDRIELQSVLKNLTRLRRKLREHNVSLTLSGVVDRTEPGIADQFMQKITCLIDVNIDDDRFGIAELCVASGMSRAQIYRKFKSFTEKTPHDYLRSYRLRRAKELLLNTKLNVSEAAYRKGFKNISHFSRIFTREFGKRPSEISR
jgi:AraC-like DNA-binding protein